MKIKITLLKSGDTDGDKAQLRKKIKAGKMKPGVDPDNDGDVDFPPRKRGGKRG